MKAKYEFDLDDADDRTHYMIYHQAVEMNISIWDFRQHLRAILKYNVENLDASALDAIEAVNEKLIEILSDNNVILD